MDTVKAQVYPMIVSFVSGFFATLGTSIAVVQQADWSTSLILGLIVSALSGGINAIFSKRVPATLGGRR